MTQSRKMEAIKMCMNDMVTWEINPTINGMVYNDVLGIKDCAPVVINRLVEHGYSISIRNEQILVNYCE